jgi:transposase
MNYTHYVGIDVSKETLDVALLHQGNLLQTQIKNTPKAIVELLSEWKLPIDSTLFCLESTGHYSTIAVATLLKLNAFVWVANPADIVKSIGIQRGKTDKIDAMRIANYAMRFNDKARTTKVNSLKYQRLKELITQRALLVANKAKYQG